jgi:hypothetical protein
MSTSPVPFPTTALKAIEENPENILKNAQHKVCYQPEQSPENS